MAVAMLLSNGSRVFRLWRDVQWLHVRRMLARPAGCVAGAYCYTLLSAQWIAAPLGIFSCCSAFPFGECFAGPASASRGAEIGAGARRLPQRRHDGRRRDPDLDPHVGRGGGSALIASDAVVSVIMGLAKVALFGRLAALNLALALTGLLVGLFTAPGAFLARAILRRIPAGVHAWIMEAVVVAGALGLLWHARGVR
jgi:hypothetical protein